MSSTNLVNPLLLADAIYEAGCLEFKQLCRLAATSAGIPATSRGLRKRVAMALSDLVAQRQYLHLKLPIWHPGVRWNAIYDSVVHLRQFPSNFLGRLQVASGEVAMRLTAQWQKAVCTQPTDIYFDPWLANRFDLPSPAVQRVSARLMLSQHWLQLACDSVIAKTDLPCAACLSAREARLLLGVPDKLPDSDVVIELAVIRTSHHATAVIALVPTTHPRDRIAIKCFFCETLLYWFGNGNDFLILGPDLDRKELD